MRAGLEICNSTQDPLSVAYMYLKNDEWTTGGWRNIDSGQCREILSGNLKNRYYYYYATRDDGSIWAGNKDDPSGCINQTKKFSMLADGPCDSNSGNERVRFRKIDTGSQLDFRVNLTHSKEPRLPTISSVLSTGSLDLARACHVISAQLQRPQLRSQRIAVGSYTDVFTPFQTKSECTNVYDTGVPDPSTCTTEYDECADEWHGPFGSWGCIPGTTTRCSHIKACNTWATYKRTMECDLYVQIKLPNIIEQPLTKFVDTSYSMIDATRAQVAAALPMVCVSEGARANASRNAAQTLAQAVVDEIKDRIRARIEYEAQKWLTETAAQTVAASIPSGGIGGAAAMATSLATLIHRIYSAVEPIVKMANDAKGMAEDLGFSTACGWSDWRRM